MICIYTIWDTYLNLDIQYINFELNYGFVSTSLHHFPAAAALLDAADPPPKPEAAALEDAEHPVGPHAADELAADPGDGAGAGTGDVDDIVMRRTRINSLNILKKIHAVKLLLTVM